MTLIPVRSNCCVFVAPWVGFVAVVLSLLVFGADLLAQENDQDFLGSEPIARDVFAEISANPLFAVAVVEEAMQKYPSQVELIVGKAIEASSAEPEVIKQIIIAAAKLADDQCKEIARVAVLAAPDQTKAIREGFVDAFAARDRAAKLARIEQTAAKMKAYRKRIEAETAQNASGTEGAERPMTVLLWQPGQPATQQEESDDIVDVEEPPKSIMAQSEQEPEVEDTKPADTRFVFGGPASSLTRDSFTPVLRSVPMSPTSP